MKTALIFCSSYKDIAPGYERLAREVVRALKDAGYGCVKSGLTVKGTMKVVSDEALACGMEIGGALPGFMKGLEYPEHCNPVWVESMSERKEEMRKGTDVAIALPGGIGTLDELSETFCLAKMGIYKGRLIAFSPDGYYENYRQQLLRCVGENMLPAGAMDLISFPSSIEELRRLL